MAFLVVWTIGPNAKADILLREDFTSGVLPAGWTNNILQGSQGWTFRSAPSFGTGGSYAVFDDQALGAGSVGNRAALETPALDFTGRTTAFIRFDHHWFGIENTLGRVEVSVNGG
ncbi:MAG: hypothetical protein KF690_03235, partial [Bacteroidetes bacterium]|nr:hypothetical protein [Bacteroidota bacterium]